MTEQTEGPEEGFNYGSIAAAAYQGSVAVEIVDRGDRNRVATVLLSPESARALARVLTIESYKIDDGVA